VRRTVAVQAPTAPKPAAATLGRTRTSTVESGDLTFPAAGRAAHVPAGLLPGIRVGRYEIVALLGAGAMGIVFEARDTELDRTVALKLVQSRVRDRQLAQARLRQEAQAMARLSHPNVASVFDIGVFDDQLFIAMELVRGHTLRDLVGAAERPWRDTLALAIPSGIHNDTAMVVDDCGDPAEPTARCAKVTPGQWLEQRIDASAYRGRSIRLGVRVRVELTARVELLLQASSGLRRVVATPVESTSWSTVELVADIQANAEAVVIRLIADSRSPAWFRDVSLDLLER